MICLYHCVKKDQEVSLCAGLLITQADLLTTLLSPAQLTPPRKRVWVKLHLMRLPALDKVPPCPPAGLGTL